jgi:MOSC domain-containing protein
MGREVAKTAPFNVGEFTSEGYWPDIEGFGYRDIVTDFNLPPGTFFDSAVIHLLTTATLKRLQRLYPEGAFAAQRFRPNVLVETGDGQVDFVENGWIDHTLSIGDAVLLRVIKPCTRCVMTTLAQGDLPRDLDILRTAVKHNSANVGVYATVMHGGVIRQGDAVRVV